MRSKKSSPPPGTPSNLGNCVAAITSAAPALKPVRMLSEMKFTSTLNRSSQASRNTPAMSKAVSEANAA